MKILKFVLPFLLFLSCSKSTEPSIGCCSDCIEKTLEDFEMVRYENQEMNCKFFMILYDWNGEQWFVLSNPCMDMISPVFNCQGIEICNDPNLANKCNDFSREAQQIEIIGISE